MNRPILHRLVAKGDLAGVREYLGRRLRAGDDAVNSLDLDGCTPLVRAVRSERADAEVVRELLSHGARVDVDGPTSSGSMRSVVRLALSGGDPAKVEALIAFGADVCYRAAHGYDALIDAVYGRDVGRDPRLIDLLELLVSAGVPLSGMSSHGESAVRHLSFVGRFDAVRVLLEAGADRDHLRWTGLHEAVALGSQADVERALCGGAPLEERDWCSRTAWLLAVLTGDITKAQLLRERGADSTARGRCGATASHFAIKNHQLPMLRWLLDLGADVEQVDDFGRTALMIAAECDDIEAVELLLSAGANVDRDRDGETALSGASTRDVVLRLLDGGADPGHLGDAGRRALLGLPSDPDPDALAGVSPAEFTRARTPRFGTANPEIVHEPFWEAMIRAGVSAYEARRWFEDPAFVELAPVWCAQRFGQSITRLPDGRIVQIGGEHEDSYDPDFWIYNDVWVHDRDGSVRVLGYPESIFSPTDFHTATLMGPFIYVIGALGNAGARRYGHTPVFRLDTRTFRFESIDAVGDSPGWIYKHRAIAISDHEIRVRGGKVVSSMGSEESHDDTTRVHVLDLRLSAWRSESS